MINRNLNRLAGAMCVAAFLIVGGSADAAFVSGTINFSQNDNVTLGGTNDINTATSFSFGSVIGNAFGNSGSFSSAPTSASNAVFTTSGPLSLSTVFTLTNANLGTFSASPGSITETQAGNNAVAFTLTGTFAPGTGFAAGSTAGSPAVLTFTFSQPGGPGGTVGMSGTLFIPAAVPEPASVAMLGLGLVGVLAVARRRVVAAK